MLLLVKLSMGQYSTDSSNFHARDKLPLIRNDSVIHLHDLAVL